MDMANRVLGSFSEHVSGAAKKRLEKLGVEIRFGHGVDQIDEDGVIVAGERIFSKTVIWTAGVAPSHAGKWLKVEHIFRAGRVRVKNDLTVPGHPEILVIGDTASLDQDGKPLPGVAQVAMQQGRYAAKLIHRRITGKTAPGPFRYFDKGSMAVVGKGLCGSAKGQNRVRRIDRLVRMGFRAFVFSGRPQSTNDGLHPMDVDLHDRPAGIATHPGSASSDLSEGVVSAAETGAISPHFLRGITSTGARSRHPDSFWTSFRLIALSRLQHAALARRRRTISTFKNANGTGRSQ